MQPTALGASRQYQIARQALTPDTNSKSNDGASVLDSAKPDAANAIADSAKDFAKVFENVESTTQAMATGQADAHSVVQAMATAEVALETAVTIRNRVVEAYQELLRMPV